MHREELVMVCGPDFSGHTRGKAFPLKDMEKRAGRGIGWVPTNVQITAFNSIADSPFGSLGDLLMVPDADAEARVDFGDGLAEEHFFLGDILHTDGTPWSCCVRGQLKRALDTLREETGLSLKCAFELEFQFQEDDPGFGPGFSLTGFRNKKQFGEVYVAALRQAGVEPDSFLREWADRQFEVTMHPQLGVKAADHALMIRELARATAHRLGENITFTPLRDPDGAGNGVHIHMSFVDADGKPATHDPDGPGGLNTNAARFVAGILHHLPDIVALTSPSAISYTRLTPHRWSAAFNNLGYRDREASVRICPVAEVQGPEAVAKQCNFEFRAGDSAASPHMQLAALVHAGLDGIRKEMDPPAPTEADLSLLSTEELAEQGFTRLPASLPKALERLAASELVKGAFGEEFLDVYLKHKQGELEFLKGMDEQEVYDAYSRVY